MKNVLRLNRATKGAAEYRRAGQRSIWSVFSGHALSLVPCPNLGIADLIVAQQDSNKSSEVCFFEPRGPVEHSACSVRSWSRMQAEPTCNVHSHPTLACQDSRGGLSMLSSSPGRCARLRHQHGMAISPSQPNMRRTFCTPRRRTKFQTVKWQCMTRGATV